MNLDPRRFERPTPAAKFSDPDLTAKGEERASVTLDRLDTLWFNTGTLCNITCTRCYIESSPTNDRLVYMTAGEVIGFLDEIAALSLATREIGFTGGEPFMNPQIIEMLDAALTRGFEVLVLTNAMQPMMRPRVMAGLERLLSVHGSRLQIRVSLDHYTRQLHDAERGEGSWDKALEGMDWLVSRGFRIAIAGRSCWGESTDQARHGYAKLFSEHAWPIDHNDASALVVLPEMDEGADVPEITTSCWGILGKSTSEMMCASSRMVVKRKGDAAPVVLPCTLIPYARAFEMGKTLRASLNADGGMFKNGAVKLCHVHCAKFCVLGGGSCSVRA